MQDKLLECKSSILKKELSQLYTPQLEMRQKLIQGDDDTDEYCKVVKDINAKRKVHL
jgi:hypothetical protein